MFTFLKSLIHSRVSYGIYKDEIIATITSFLLYYIIGSDSRTNENPGYKANINDDGKVGNPQNELPRIYRRPFI